MKIDITAHQRALKISKYIMGDSVLDVGSNFQLLKPYCQNKFYLGLDIDSNDSKPDILGDGLNLPFIDMSFDTVVATEIIEHVPNPLQLLKECSRVCRNRLIVTTPNPFRIDYITEWILRKLEMDSGGHLYKLSKNNMLNLAKVVGDLKLKEFKNISMQIPTFSRYQSIVLDIDCRFSGTSMYIFEVL